MSGADIWFWVALAGGAGAVARVVVDGYVLARTGGRLPWGTALINISGAFALGLIAGIAPSHGVSRTCAWSTTCRPAGSTAHT